MSYNSVFNRVTLTFTHHLLLLILYLSTTGLCLISPKEVRGTRFVDTITNEPFIIRGLDYQPGGSSLIRKNSPQDPLSNVEICKRDIALFQTLGINTIRVYSINPNLNHDVCMTLLASAGIYLLLDVNSPLMNEHLNRHDPDSSYNVLYLEHIFAVVDQFSGYNNTLGFFAGNEVVNDALSASKSSKFVKRVVGDIKYYINSKKDSQPNWRRVPVGYSAADDLRYRVPLSKYLECSDSDENENENENENEKAEEDNSIDFYGVNSYQWCGSQTRQTSGYDKLVEAYKDFSKPVFLSEFGCNRVLPREFSEISALYTGKMLEVFSGGLVYEFSQEPNNYGLVKLSSADNSARILPDYKRLQRRYRDLGENDNNKLPRIGVGNSGTNKPKLCSDPDIQEQYESLKMSIAEPPAKLAMQVVSASTSRKKEGESSQTRVGKYVNLTPGITNATKYEIYDVDGESGESPWSDTQKRIRIIYKIEVDENDTQADNHNQFRDKDYSTGTGTSNMTRARGRHAGGGSDSNSSTNETKNGASTLGNICVQGLLHGMLLCFSVTYLLIRLF